MSAWILAVLLCGRASAAVVVEVGGAAANAGGASGAVGTTLGAGASPLGAVPSAAVLAPALNAGAVISAFPGRAATGLPAGALTLAPAPLPALPAAAAALSAPAAPGANQAAPVSAPTDALPPATAAAPQASAAAGPGAKVRAAAPGSTAVGALAARLDASGAEAAPAVQDGLDRVSNESASAFGRRVFDRSADRAATADGALAASGDAGLSAAPGRRAPALAPSSARFVPAALDGPAAGETLRDAVASPFVGAALPRAGAAFAPGSAPGIASGRSASSFGLDPIAAAAVPGAPAAPRSFERLSLELGSGLVVKVRAALGLTTAASARPFGAGTKASAAVRAISVPVAALARERAPVTSTEWLERRGLLESLSAAEEAAAQTAAAASAAAPAPAASAAVPALVLDPTTPARVPPLAWWSLAFLPALAVLLKELV